MILTLIQALIFLSYVTFLWIKFKGPLPSISESWYRLKELGGTSYGWFTLFCMSLGFTMFFQADITNPVPLFFISGASLVFVGVATMYKSKTSPDKWMHPLCAAICIVFGLIGVGVEHHSWIPTIAFVLATGIIKLSKINNATWWIEMVAFLSILGGLLIF